MARFSVGSFLMDINIPMFILFVNKYMYVFVDAVNFSRYVFCMGRKKLPENERRDTTFQIMVNDDEMAQIGEAAKAWFEGEELPGRGVASTWARRILLAAAKKQLKKKN